MLCGTNRDCYSFKKKKKKKKRKKTGTRIYGHQNTKMRAKLEKNQTIDKSIAK